MVYEETFKQFCMSTMAAARAKKFQENVATLMREEKMDRFEQQVRLEQILHRLAFEAYQLGFSDGSIETHTRINNLMFEIGMDQLDVLGMFDEGNKFNSDPTTRDD